MAHRARRHRAVARPLHAQRGRHLPRPDREGLRRPIPILGVLPRPSGDRPGLRRQGHPRAGAGARQALDRSTTTRHRACSAASTARSRRRAIIPLIVERATFPARPRSHRRDRRQAGDGPRPSQPAGAWRAVSSRKHRVRARPSDAEEFSRPSPPPGTPPTGLHAVAAPESRARVAIWRVEHRGRRFQRSLIAKVATGASLSRDEGRAMPSTA